MTTCSLIALVLVAMLMTVGTPAAAQTTKVQRSITTHLVHTGVAHKVSGKGKGLRTPTKASPTVLAWRAAMMKKVNRPLPATPVASGTSTRARSVPLTQIGLPKAKAVPFAAVSTTVNDLGVNTTSDVNEPSVASDGSNELETWNWYSGISTNGGASWTYYDPSTLFPNDYGGWCCDSVAVYDGSRNLFLWNLLYLPNSNGGAFRLAVANGASNLANASFYYWDLTPQQIGGSVGDWYDYPKIALSSNYAYLQTNQYNASGNSVQTVVMRFALNDLAAGGSLGYSYLGLPGVFSSAFSNGATGTMYFAGHVSNSTLRVFSWNEGSGSVSSNDVNHVSYPTNGFSCPRTNVANSNWCARSDDRPLDGWVSNGVIGFSWNAPQGQWGFTGSAPYPYTDIVRINQSNMSKIDDPVVWNSNYAFMYMSHYPNVNGDLGGTFMYGGGSLYENGGSYIWDGLGRNFVGVVGSNQDATEGGDYLTTRPIGSSWVGTMYALLSDGVHTYNVTFGR